jgi:putative transposase
MPAKNSIKEYVINGFYHIYNRGVEERQIFIDEFDYGAFLSILKKSLCLSDDDLFHAQRNLKFNEKIELFAYCLMPNHFHLLIRQKDEKDIAVFMKSLITKYVIYFNKRHRREGVLFQGRYRGILVKEDGYLLHVSRYIHLNPQAIGFDPAKYKHSSYVNYLGLKKSRWLKTDYILDYFNNDYLKKDVNQKIMSYKHFVEEGQMLHRV